jgi:Mlc titration factor MtfA (ptsG expression regulator)/regulator of sirC expression with transglutaminase-like and TPR domain
MVFSWFKDRRRKQLLAEPFPAAWQQYLVNNVRHYAYLDPAWQATVRTVARVVVAEKHWSGGAGFTVTDEMKVTVAAQASLLVLGLDEPYFFDRAASIILYSGAYVRPPRLQRYLNVAEGIPFSGEAWYHSPIVLSWQHVLQAGRNASNGGNLVLHEFAHHLDGLDGEVDGTPPLVGRERENTWYRVTEAEYRRLVGQAKRHEVTLLDTYGATNKAEFFAVATECFFEQPHLMQQQHEELYAVLRDFYRQDPARWLPDATINPLHRDQRAAEGNEPADAVALQSEDADALFTFAVTCLNDGRYDLAERAATRAIDLDPTDAEVYQHRAAARIKLGSYMAALEDCHRALRLDDSDVDAYRTRGAAYVGLQQYELAKDDLDRVLRENKMDAEAYRLRGSAWVGLNQLPRAVSDFSMSIAQNPLSAEAYYQRGLAYRRQGRSEDADADLEKAFQLDPQVDRRR